MNAEVRMSSLIGGADISGQHFGTLDKMVLISAGDPVSSHSPKTCLLGLC